MFKCASISSFQVLSESVSESLLLFRISSKSSKTSDASDTIDTGNASNAGNASDASKQDNQ